MSYDKTLKIRVDDSIIDKAKKDSEYLGENKLSEHIRNLIVDFEYVSGLNK